MYLREFIDTLVNELRQFFDEYLNLDGPTERLRKQLRIMYGRGEVNRDTFFRMLSLLDKGYFIEGELMTLHRQAFYRMEREGLVLTHSDDRKLSQRLDSVYLQRAKLEEARHGMEVALKTLDRERTWMVDKAEVFYKQAQTSLPDEEAARKNLLMRQELLDLVEMVDQRKKTMQEEKNRLDQLEAQLRFYESELLVLHSREQLALEVLTTQKRLYP